MPRSTWMCKSGRYPNLFPTDFSALLATIKSVAYRTHVFKPSVNYGIPRLKFDNSLNIH
jgi:hypothetical protein